MVVDVKKFKNITDLRSRNYYLEQEKLSDFKDILWVAEQLPGLFVNKDQTEILLKRTYWASYGLPFYEVSINNDRS